MPIDVAVAQRPAPTDPVGYALRAGACMSALQLPGGQTVTAGCIGQQMLGVVGVYFELLAEPPHGDPYISRVRRVRVGPYLAQQLLG